MDLSNIHPKLRAMHDRINLIAANTTKISSPADRFSPLPDVIVGIVKILRPDLDAVVESPVKHVGNIDAIEFTLRVSNANDTLVLPIQIDLMDVGVGNVSQITMSLINGILQTIVTRL